MTQKTKAVLTFVPFVFLLALTAYLQYASATAPRVVVAVQGYDPRDLLSGHYIAYAIDWNKTDMTQFREGVCSREAFDSFIGRQRFYIPEADAPALDAKFRRRGDLFSFSVVYACPKFGKPLARQLLINGRDWRDSFIKTGRNQPPKTF